jgi:hypothetical protein
MSKKKKNAKFSGAKMIPLCLLALIVLFYGGKLYYSYLQDEGVKHTFPADSENFNFAVASEYVPGDNALFTVEEVVENKIYIVPRGEEYFIDYYTKNNESFDREFSFKYGNVYYKENLNDEEKVFLEGDSVMPSIEFPEEYTIIEANSVEFSQFKFEVGDDVPAGVYLFHPQRYVSDESGQKMKSEFMELDIAIGLGISIIVFDDEVAPLTYSSYPEQIKQAANNKFFLHLRWLAVGILLTFSIYFFYKSSKAK